MRKMTAAMAALGVVAGLGAAALPLSSYAAQASKTVPVTAIIDDSLSIEIQDADNNQLDAKGVVLENVVPGGDVVSKSVKVVVTNNGSDALTGTSLMIEAANGQTALEQKGDNGLVAASIAAGSTNVKAGTTTSAWGYAVNAGTSYKAITTTAAPVAFDPALTGNLAAEGTASAKVTFGVAAATGQKGGVYTGGVVFTASATTAE